MVTILDDDDCSNAQLSYVFGRYQGTARLMFNSFASSLWMLPFSKNCRADNAYWKHFSGGSKHGHHMYHCEEQEFRSNFSGFPTNIINIEIPSIRRKTFETNAGLTETVFLSFSTCFLCLVRAGFDAYPSVAEVAEANLSSMECGLPTQLSFSAREISDGTFFKAIEDYDPDSKRLLYQLEKWVLSC